MTMKIYNRIFIVIAALVSIVACVNEPKVEFGLDTTDIQVGPEGGVRTIKVSSSGCKYTAAVDHYISGQW